MFSCLRWVHFPLLWGKGVRKGMLKEDASYGNLKKERLPYLGDKLCSKLAFESKTLVFSVVFWLFVVWEEKNFVKTQLFVGKCIWYIYKRLQTPHVKRWQHWLVSVGHVVLYMQCLYCEAAKSCQRNFVKKAFQ